MTNLAFSYAFWITARNTLTRSWCHRVAIELDSAALHFIFGSMQVCQAQLRSVVLCDDGPLSYSRTRRQTGFFDHRFMLSRTRFDYAVRKLLTMPTICFCETHACNAEAIAATGHGCRALGFANGSPCGHAVDYISVMGAKSAHVRRVVLADPNRPTTAVEDDVGGW